MGFQSLNREKLVCHHFNSGTRCIFCMLCFNRSIAKSSFATIIAHGQYILALISFNRSIAKSSFATRPPVGCPALTWKFQSLNREKLVCHARNALLRCRNNVSFQSLNREKLVCHTCDPQPDCEDWAVSIAQSRKARLPQRG